MRSTQDVAARIAKCTQRWIRERVTLPALNCLTHPVGRYIEPAINVANPDRSANHVGNCRMCTELIEVSAVRSPESDRVGTSARECIDAGKPPITENVRAWTRSQPLFSLSEWQLVNKIRGN